MMSETKPDNNFPQGQFLIDSFNSAFRFNHNKNDEEIALTEWEDIPL